MKPLEFFQITTLFYKTSKSFFPVAFVYDNFARSIELGFKRRAVVLPSIELQANLPHPFVTLSHICYLPMQMVNFEAACVSLALCVVLSFHRSRLGQLPLGDAHLLSSHIRRLCFQTTDFAEYLCSVGMNSGLSLKSVKGCKVVHLNACSMCKDAADSYHD